MVDRFGRDITYLRVSVSGGCNLRCVYCEPTAESERVVEQLSFDEICDVVRAAVRTGVRKVRLTGGEPLLRPNLLVLVRMLARMGAIDDLSLSTNGILLAEHARALAGAGLKRVNVSLDSLDARRYAEITGGGELRRVLAGIEAAKAAGLAPVKLNCVVGASASEPDARQVARFAAEHGLEVRFVPRMNFRTGEFSVVQGGAGGDCAHCNRLRLSYDGLIRPCLFSDLGFSVRDLGTAAALEEAVRWKPERGAACSRSWIRATGG